MEGWRRKISKMKIFWPIWNYKTKQKHTKKKRKKKYTPLLFIVTILNLPFFSLLPQLELGESGTGFFHPKSRGFSPSSRAQCRLALDCRGLCKTFFPPTWREKTFPPHPRGKGLSASFLQIPFSRDLSPPWFFYYWGRVLLLLLLFHFFSLAPSHCEKKTLPSWC